MAEERIRLAKVVQNLRQELIEATRAGEGEELRFELGEVKLEAQVVVTEETHGKAGVRFYVLNAEAAGKEQLSRTQKITLTLTPRGAGGQAAEEGAVLLAAPE